MDPHAARLTDPGRLAAVDRTHLVGAVPAEGLERAAALVRTVLGVPAAFVTVVEADRQFVVAERGFTDALGAPAEGPLTHSYCREVVGGDAPLVVPDAGRSGLSCAGLLAESFGIGAYLGVPVRSAEGDPVGALCAIDGAPRAWTPAEVETMTALAATVETEIALRAELDRRDRVESRYHALFDGSPDAVLLLDPDTEEVLGANAAACALYGRDRDDLVGMSAKAFSRETARGEAVASRLVAEGGSARFDTVQLRADGSPVDVRVSASAVRLGGRPVLLSVNRDVTDVKRAERELAEARALNDRLALVAAKTTNGVVMTDADGLTEWVNEGFTRITGYTLDDLRGRKPGHVLQGPDTDPETVAFLHERMRTREPFSAELVNVHKNGTPYWIRIEVSPLVEDDGTLTGFMAIETDITERKRAEATLRESESRFRLVTETAGVGMFVSDVERGRTTFTMPGHQVLGYQEAEPFTFARFAELVHPDDRDRVTAAIEHAKDPAGTGRANFDHRVVRPDTGAVRWVAVKVEAVFEGEGPGRRAAQLCGVILDATERKRAEAEARESEARFRLLTETATDVILTIDETGTVVYANEAARAVFGYAPDELVGNELSAILPDRFRAAHREGLARYLASGERRLDWAAVELPGRRRDGTELPLSVTFGEYAQGGRRFFTAIVRDVSAREEAQRALKESEAQYRTLVEAVRDAVIETDAEGHITFVNPAWERITGVAAADSLGQIARSFVHPDDHAAHDAGFAPLVAGDVAFVRFESRVLHADGDVRHVEIQTELRRDEAGTVVGTVGTVTDITDAARFEAEREARQRADEMLRLKSAFLDNMSHELRTPLTAILGFASVLAEEVPEEQREWAEAIVRGGDRLQSTLNAVLDLSQLEAGAVAVKAAPLDARAAAGEAADRLRAVADAAGLSLTVAGSGRALADADALGRALGHVLDNAVKFTPAGRVTVEVAESAGRVRVRVADTGVGMPAAFVPRAFEAFTQASDGHGRAYEGNGLGLTIARRLVELMGSEIAVESAEGVGTTVTVDLPAAPAPVLTWRPLDTEPPARTGATVPYASGTGTP
ncbi:PAS domain S-box protein [Rubrivirga sp.]|uniref:PAS domain S-box protein n=1 Tax=Rubrivirga sp. TaxID=1885344 RepID=UPI003B519310